jgi:hypothetical protein
MSESFLERLSRFTPDPGRLDRDALLFEAGKASARPNRGWITLTSLLAATQILSLILLWPRPTPPQNGLTAPFVTVPTHPSPVEAPAEQPGRFSPWSTRYDLPESKADPRPDSDSLIDSGPPLRAFGPPPPSILY